METLRGLSLWLGAALLGSLGCTVVLNVALHGGWSGFDLRAVQALAVASLFWTLPGSALLSMAFAWTGQRGLSPPLRRALLVPLGATLGAAVMLPFGAASAIVGGLSYGLATALGWSLLHRVLYGAR